MKTKVLVIVSGILALATIAQSQQCITLEVPYIHQVLDMDTNVFQGHNACGSVSAYAMTVNWGLRPPLTEPWSSPARGRYIYEAYTDLRGNPYTETAMDMSASLQHIHSVQGAHGFIVERSLRNGQEYWGTDQTQLITFLQQHGLQVEKKEESTDPLWSIIQQEIEAGFPLIGHVSFGANGGHYFVITGVAGYKQIVCNDPYGNANTTWNGSERNGEDVVYSLDTYGPSRVGTVNRVYLCHPIGLTAVYPAWSADFSQAFVDCFNRKGSSVLGSPHDNGGTKYAHDWNGVTIQDLKKDANHYALVYNPVLDQAFLLRQGFRLQYLNNSNAPSEYGPPRTDEVANWKDTTGAYGDAGRTYSAAQEFDRVVMLWNGTQVLVKSRVPSVHIMIVPGTGVTLTGWPLSPTSAYLTTSDSGATRYSLYRDGTSIGDLANFELVDENLTPETTYAYQLIAFNADGSERGRSPTISLTTPASAPPSVPLADFEYWMRTGGFEIGVPTYSGATTASIIVGPQSYQATPNSLAQFQNTSLTLDYVSATITTE